jgi:exopolysaccharide production protein ExoQ
VADLNLVSVALRPSRQRNAGGDLVRSVCMFFMILSTGAFNFIDRMIYGSWPGKPGDKLTETLNLLAIVVSVLLFWWGTRRLRRFNRVLPLAAASLLVTSVLWSVDPSTTTTRSVAYFFLVVGAIGIVEILDSDEVMSLTASIAGLLAGCSLILLFILPDTVSGEFAGEYIFRGLFSGKNQLGQAMAIGILGGLHGIRVGRRRFSSIGLTVLCTTVAFLAKSATALLAIFAFFILHIIGTFYIRGGIRMRISICMAQLAAGAFILLMVNIDLIYKFLDKDPTLTGRTDFWPYIIPYIYQSPLLGWGFAAFWMESNPYSAEIISTIGGVNEAHNGMLQLLLDIGIVGTALFLFLWIRNLVMAVKCMNGPAPEIGVSSLLLLVGILIIGVSEQVLTTADGLTTQFFLLGFMCEKGLWRARQAKYVVLQDAAVPLDQLAGLRREEGV